MATATKSAEALSIDRETLEMLEGEVKKGKSRKFVLIHKGAQIKKLIVFKKGPYNSRIQQAKKSGFRGEVVTGVVTGSGVRLDFQMAGTASVAGAMGVDGVVDKEPTKVAKLREFLADNNLKRKPTYQCVTSVEDLKQSQPSQGSNGSATTRTVPGGGGYVYEQHADGSIVIVQSPRRGNARTKVKHGSKAYQAILAEIGPFPKSGEQPAGKQRSNASSVLDKLGDYVDGAADLAGDVFDGLVDGVADLIGDGEEKAPEQTNDAPDILGGADTVVEKKLAEFAHAISNIVVIVDGKPVSVRPPYHWNRKGHKIKVDAEEARKKNSAVRKLLKKTFKGEFGTGAKIGKATPEQMTAFLQNAVDEKLVKDKTAKGLRKFLDLYGVSTDCSGLATQALNFLNDGDMSRDSEDAIDTVGEANCTKIASYPKVAQPSVLQAGDTMVRSGSHVRLIIDVDIEEDGVYFTTLESTTAKVSEHGQGVGERRWRFPDPGKFKNVEAEQNGKFRRSSKDQDYTYTRHKSMERAE